MAISFRVRLDGISENFFSSLRSESYNSYYQSLSDSEILDNILCNVKLFELCVGLSLDEWLKTNQSDLYREFITEASPKITIGNHHFDITDIEDSPNLIGFKEAIRKASNDYKKQFVTVDLNERSNKMTLQLLFIYVKNDKSIDQGNKNLLRLLYTEIVPQLKEGIIELDIESLKLIKNMFSYVLNNPSTDHELLEDFKYLETTFDKHIIDKTNHLIIQNNE